MLRDAPVGSMLIQSDSDSGEPLLYDLLLPSCLTLSSESAAKSWVLLLDSQIGFVLLSAISSQYKSNQSTLELVRLL